MNVHSIMVQKCYVSPFVWRTRGINELLTDTVNDEEKVLVEETKSIHLGLESLIYLQLIKPSCYAYKTKAFSAKTRALNFSPNSAIQNVCYLKILAVYKHFLMATETHFFSHTAGQFKIWPDVFTCQAVFCEPHRQAKNTRWEKIPSHI